MQVCWVTLFLMLIWNLVKILNDRIFMVFFIHGRLYEMVFKVDLNIEFGFKIQDKLELLLVKEHEVLSTLTNSTSPSWPMYEAVNMSAA